jgi:hypothetical protein
MAWVIVLSTALAGLNGDVLAYSEFQTWSQNQSGRFVNCAMCHAHPDGPNGVKPGQIGSLTPEQIPALTEARLAFEPGQEVHSPILNEFGNSIVTQLGRTAVISLQLDPAALADRINQESDHDRDGIPDAVEYRMGTHPLDKESGDPWMLFTGNFTRQRFHIAMIVLATVFGLYGFNHLMRGLHGVASRHRR